MNEIAVDSFDAAAIATEVVESYLIALTLPDPDAAATYVSDDVEVTSIGGISLEHPNEVSTRDAVRYRRVEKRMERIDIAPSAEETVIYSIGTLSGEWPDGTLFEGDRYVERYVVRDKLIIKIDIWNDSGERILQKLGRNDLSPPCIPGLCSRLRQPGVIPQRLDTDYR